MTKPKNNFTAKTTVRVPDDLWLTPRCQAVVNAWNEGRLSEERALSELEMVGNTLDQAKAILERHRGLTRKVKQVKPGDPLRRVKK